MVLERLLELELDLLVVRDELFLIGCHHTLRDLLIKLLRVECAALLAEPGLLPGCDPVAEEVLSFLIGLDENCIVVQL